MWKNVTDPTVLHKWHVLCVEWVDKPDCTECSIWVNGKHVSNFQSYFYYKRPLKGSDTFLIIGDESQNGLNGLYGDIAAIEMYSHKSTRVPDVMKQGIMVTLCRKYGIKPDIDTVES